MDIEESENEIKEVVESKDLLKIPLNKEEEKYLLKIFPSKDNISIIFKLEKEKVQTYYYYAKYDLKDFKQINKKFISEKNIYNAFLKLKEITQTSICKIEKKLMKMNIQFTKKNTEFSAIFTVRKKIVAQSRLNAQIIEQIQENKAKIKMLKKQIAKLDKIIQNKNEMIDNINNNIDKISNTVNNININTNNNDNNDNNDSDNSKGTSNNSNSNKTISPNSSIISDKSSLSKDQSDTENKDSKQIEEKENILLKKNLSLIKEYQQSEQENEGKRYISNNRKLKNKNKIKQMKYMFKNEEKQNSQNQQQEETLFCFENIDVFRNKKIYETLIIFNAITVLIIMYLLCSIYALKSNLTFEKIKDQELMKKFAFLSLLDDSNDDDMGGMRENIVDFNLKDNDEENSNINSNLNSNQKVKYAIIRKKQNNNRKDQYLLVEEKEKKYFKKHIRKKVRFRMKDINFNLVFSSKESSRYMNLFKYNKNNFDILLFIRTKTGQKFCLFSNLLILFEQNLENKKDFYAGYIYSNEYIYEMDLNEFFKHHTIYLKSIFSFLRKEKNLHNDDDDEKISSTQSLEDIDLFEVYQINYVK